MKPSKLLRATVVVALWVLVGACASEQPQPEPQPQPTPTRKAHTTHISEIDLSQKGLPPVPSAELQDFKQIQALYAKQDYAGTITKLDEFTTNYPQSNLIPQAQNLWGLSLLMTKQAVLAIPHFEQAINLNQSNPTLNSYLFYNLAKAQTDAGRLDDAEQSLNRIPVASLDNDNQIKFHFLKANLFERRKFYYEAATEFLEAAPLVAKQAATNTPERKKNLQDNIDNSIQQITGTAPIEDLYQAHENSPFADLLLFRLGSKELTLGNNSQAEVHLRTLLARYPDSPFAAQAKALLEPIASQAELDRTQIGVLLPVRGKFAAYGTRSLQAIELAFHIFDSANDSGYTLVIEDSGDEPDQAVKALNRLVQKHHVAAVIGPLLSKGIDQVSKRAEELGVPMISLARHAASGDAHEVVQGGLTLRLQAQEIARYATQDLGLKSFAIAAPKDKVGAETAQYFWDAVEADGGKVVGIESYNPNETDFREVVDKLSGLYYTEARQKELDDLAEQRKVNQIRKKTRKTEQYFNLKPLADYEAVFVPDDPKVAGQILPTFAYRDVDHVRFLGVSAWNSPDFVARAQSYAEGALFTDVFGASNTHSPKAARFTQQYKATFGQDASDMEAIAYDAALVLKHALDEAGKSYSRSDLLKEIENTRNFDGVTGKISFQNGQLDRALQILTVQHGQIIEASAAAAPKKER